ncbi:MAG: ABC transporter substrate-binding protein [Bacteroidales bacterium]|nr:ABC transporter substrate-binding protein [Bacteroidales bacterium]
MPRFLALFFVLMIFCLISSCRHSQKSDNKRTVFRYNESSGISSLDPAFARNQANIWAINQLFNGLLQLDEQLSPQPCIAKSWIISENGLVYTFHLRNDVYFHDSGIFTFGKGRKVVANDFVYSFNRLTDPTTASPGAWIFNQVEQVNNKYAFKALNDTTLEIRLKSPFPPFPGLLCMQYCSVIPREAIDAYGADFRKNPIGTGPFRLKYWKEGVKLVMEKNQHYFENENGATLPYLDAISVSFIVDKQSAFLEFIKGNLDFMSGIDASYKDELLSRSGELNPKYASKISLTKAPYLNTEYLGILVDSSMRSNANNPLSDQYIRQAINYGFDRVKMMQYLRNNIGIAGTAGFIPPGLPWFETSEIPGYNFNPALAKELMAKAGYPGGAGLPPITLSTNASYLDLCKYIQSQLNELGFDIRIDVSPPATLRDMIAKSEVPFFRGSWIADYPDAENYLSLFTTANFCPVGPNYTHFSDKEFDKLYNQALTERNDSVRGKLYMKMDQLIMKKAPVVVLYYDQVLRFSGNNIRNLGSNPLNLLTLKKVQKINLSNQ